MENYHITFKVDGKIITEDEIRSVELERYHHVFNVFNQKNIPVKLDGQLYGLESLLNLSLEKAKEALAQTREEIGKEETLKLFRPEIAKSNDMWRYIADESPDPQEFQAGIVEVETENISLSQFLMFNQLLAKKNNLYLPSTIHPEHYYFDANKKGEQTIIETFGMYKEPSYLDLRPAKDIDYPIEPDSGVSLVMAGQTFLKSLNTDTKLIGMHQLTRTESGMKVKLGVFLPKATPKEIVEGHKWHLMVEFNNGLHLAAQQHPNTIQTLFLENAIKRMEKKQELFLKAKSN
ncbi:hypothetical protein ACTL31_02120 [Leuconostoc mesenteroides]